MRCVFLDNQRPSKRVYYTVPYVLGGMDLLAEWRPDIYMCQETRFLAKEFPLRVATVDSQYTGKVYWGWHAIESKNCGEYAALHFLKKYGIPVAELDAITAFKLDQSNFMFELVVPRCALLNIANANEQMLMEFDAAVESRWASIKKGEVLE